MAKKTAAKKPEGKKPRRRLKRTARRSLAAVLMITAVVVAAIPVPENAAAPEGGSSVARAVDVHTEALEDKTSGFKYDAKNKEITGIATAKWAKANLNEFVGTNTDGSQYLDETAIWKSYNRDTSSTKKPVNASLAIRNVGGRDALVWQFLFYEVDISGAGVTGGGLREVICMYNGEFVAEGIDLPMYLNTEYYTVAESVISNYFKGLTPDGKSLTTVDSVSWNDYVDEWPNREYTYKYADYVKETESENKTDVAAFFDEYFANDSDFVTLKNGYKEYMDSYDEETDTYSGDESLKTATLTRHPYDIKDSGKQVEFYCAHDKVLKAQAEPFTLVAVNDLHSNTSRGIVYVAKGGKASDKPKYFTDEKGYLVKKQTDVPICGIGGYAFAGSDRIRNLVLPSAINFIGDHAFEGAGMISSITIESAPFIGNQAFKNCTSLNNVEIKAGTNTIGAECFYGTPVTSIKLPSTIRNIGYGAFANCGKLTNLDLNDISHECEIDGYAFYECSVLSTVNMRDANIISIGDGAFACTGGAQIDFVFPKGMKSEGGVNSIGDFMFAGRTGLNSVVFPESYGKTRADAVKLPSNMFHGCVSLSYVRFPNDDAIYDCSYVSYDGDKLFADVVNENFYVQGPKESSPQTAAEPRKATWTAVTAIKGNPIPYLYVEDGKEYYEVSNGIYLYCVNPEGVITSCTLHPDAPLDEIKRDGIDLEIKKEVGTRKIIGLQKGCFSDENLNQNVKTLVIPDDSLTSIDDEVFKGWKRLSEVTIGNSVKTIGKSAFEGCVKLIDVTFHSPSFDHKEFQLGEDAFKTGSSELTFHGDIVKGYAPFAWAMDPKNIIDGDSEATQGIRVCYKSMAPTFITVMYNPITDMVTMLDYPKYDQIDTILADAHKKDLEAFGVSSYNEYRQAYLYNLYRDGNDDRRTAFANAWSAAVEKGTKEAKDAVYASDNYGPWVNPEFAADWEKAVSGTAVPNTSGTTTDTGAAAEMMDWLFEPLTVYAAEDDPDPYYSHKGNEYNVLLNASAHDPYRPSTPEEDYLLYAVQNIVVPEGVESIDVYGYVNDLTRDGKEYEGNGPRNSGNASKYFTGGSSNNSWDISTKRMYTAGAISESEDDPDTAVRSVPGLFSGYYKEPSENNPRGNDTIKTVTMNSVKYLPDYAFDNCEQLQSVVLGKDCADIGIAPFRGCMALRSVSNNDYYETDNGIIYSKASDGSYVIEECFASRGNPEIVGQGAVSVSNDPKLTTVSAIREGAFEDCDVINSVNFGNNNTAGLAVVPKNCFKDCEDLQTVVLPMSVNDIESGAFAGSNHLSNLTIYGKEVKISGQAFDGDPTKSMTNVRAYKDSAVVRYVKEYGTDYRLQLDDEPLGEQWQVTFVGPDYSILELEDKDGKEIANPQYVADGLTPTVPKNPVLEGWTFDKWVGMNNSVLGDPIEEDTVYFAQGYSNSGMVGGKYVVQYIDQIDGSIFATQYVTPGEDAPSLMPPSHEGFIFDGYASDLTNIQSNTSVMAKYKAIGGTTNISGGTTNTSGGTTNTSGGTTNTSTTSSSSNKSSSSSSSSSSTSTSSTTSDANAVSMHRVTVVGGSGSGTYATGATVVISANEPAAGMKFTQWTTESSGVTFNQMTATSTMFVMPENDVLVVANFEAGNAAVNPAGITPAVAPVSTTNNDQTEDNGNTRVDISKPGISNKDLATANVNGSTDNFVIKISETDEATKAVAAALTNKYGTLDNILYYAMDITLWDSTGSYQLTGDQLNGISVDITIPIPDSLVAYGGNNMAGAVINGDQLESLNENFTTINGVPCVRFQATHFSPYTIYVDTGNLVEGMLDTTPQTGDPIHPKWFLSLGLACLSIILFLKRDKKTAVKVKAKS